MMEEITSKAKQNYQQHKITNNIKLQTTKNYKQLKITNKTKNNTKLQT